MANEFDWTTPRAALIAELAGATGTELAIGNALAATILTLGTAYDAAFTPATDTAKGTWLAGASSAFEGADDTCRYIEDLVGSPGAALTFDAYDDKAIRARLASAAGKAPDAATTGIVAAFAAAFDAAWTAKLLPYTADETAEVQVPVEVSRAPRSAAMTRMLERLGLAGIEQLLAVDRSTPRGLGLARAYGVDLDELLALGSPPAAPKLRTVTEVVKTAVRVAELVLVGKCREAEALAAALAAFP